MSLYFYATGALHTLLIVIYKLIKNVVSEGTTIIFKPEGNPLGVVYIHSGNFVHLANGTLFTGTAICLLQRVAGQGGGKKIRLESVKLNFLLSFTD